MALMLLFGFASGLPLFLTNFTLQQWLSESHVSLRAIGATALIGLPYTLKFLWAPIADRVAPLGLGRRRGWLFVIQPLLALAIVRLGFSNPPHALPTIAAAALAVAFLSASQDIVIDAWRIESFPARQQGEALARYVWGYRIAILVSQAGAIWLSTRLGWHGAYAVMAALVLLGLIPTLLAREPVQTNPIARGLRGAVLEPLSDFLARPNAAPILAFVLLFQLGTALADNLAAPFSHSLGFDRAAIALASGLPALAGAALGVFAGGRLVRGLGNRRALLICALIQMVSLLLYVLLIRTGADRTILIAKVTLEAFAEGMASAAFLAYLSGLCTAAYTATQYALLSSLAPLPWRTLAGASGAIAAELGWTGYFALSAAACLPAILILLWLRRAEPVAATLVRN